MNSLQPAAQTVKQLTFTIGTPLPFIWGAQDAASGLECVPEKVFVTRPDQINYAAGWASVAGNNDTTRYFLEVN